MMLTKTTAVFLVPAVGWAMLVPLWESARKLVDGVACGGDERGSWWMARGLVDCVAGIVPDYHYFSIVNTYPAGGSLGRW